MHAIGPLVRGAVQRTRYGGWRNSAGYLLTRFHVVRRIGAALHRRGRPTPASVESESLFSIDAQEVAGAIDQHSYFAPLTLPSSVVAPLYDFADTTTCTTYGGYAGRGGRVDYHRKSWRDAERQLGKPIVLGRIYDSYELCPLVRRIAHDPLLHAVARRYFGYPSSHIDARLYWSFARDGDGDLNLDTRAERGQNVKYHYDLHRGYCSYLFFQFYLTDADASRGAMVLIPGSHRRKPLRALLGSANQPEKRVLDWYGADSPICVEGPAGLGFVMDGYCMHKAVPPRRDDRLFLQVRIA